MRKLLLLVCGSKDQYRHLRDMHTLETSMTCVKNIVSKGSDLQLGEPSSINLQYDDLIHLIEQLKACVEVTFDT